MRSIAKYFTIVYLSIFMLLASIAVPYVAHTCNITKHTDISLMSNGAFCHHSKENKCHNAPKSDKESKSSCCDSVEGVISSDTDLITSSVVTFYPLLSVRTIHILLDYYQFLKPQHIVYPSADKQNLQQVPLQVIFQSFLC